MSNSLINDLRISVGRAQDGMTYNKEALFDNVLRLCDAHIRLTKAYNDTQCQSKEPKPDFGNIFGDIFGSNR